MIILKQVLTSALTMALLTPFLTFFFNRSLQKQKRNFEQELEHLKNYLQLEFSHEQEKLNQKRNVYKELINAMIVFSKARVSEDERIMYQNNFLKAYDNSWLWASEEVLLAVTNFIDFKISVYGDFSASDEAREKELISECIFVIRKDIGFEDTILTKDHYRFINF
ncbi:hypothetical protein [Lysinibacillus sp. Ag94]|uniref:hypothetical protein n=1 Tax=Lysinibacillus sp. Ag94 TaxID=2936682 RepID=UPI00200C502F|nr:hypothetical protein [Lysinibacillus sp. Ag94]UPW82706.1 hypothetical protein MY533_18625 [Lysinibacillus sp. Ag94]